MKNKAEIVEYVQEFIKISDMKKEHEDTAKRLDEHRKDLIAKIGGLMDGHLCIRLQGYKIVLNHVNQSRLDQAKATDMISKAGMIVPQMGVKYDTLTVKPGQLGDDAVLDN
jgi:UDP:flavonoid glycosyltransferase YjiC (YdhE family)